MAAELLREYEHDIDSVTLIPSDGGRFEVTVDSELVFSKKSLGRHAEQGEVAELIGQRLGGDS